MRIKGVKDPPGIRPVGLWNSEVNYWERKTWTSSRGINSFSCVGVNLLNANDWWYLFIFEIDSF